MEDRKGITDEELEPFKVLFDNAYAAIDAGKEKAMIINQLAKDLKTAGFVEDKICSAITKKLTVASLEDGKKYANKDYISKVLPKNFKDYQHGKKKGVLEQEKQQQQIQREKEKKLLIGTAQKPTTTGTKPLNEKLVKGISEAIQEEIQIGKEKGLESAIELEEAIESEPEIEIEDVKEQPASLTVIDAPTPVKGPTMKEKAQEMQQELNALQNQLDMARIQRDDAQNNFNRKSTEFDALEKDYGTLLEQYNEVVKPFMERQWIQVNTLNADGEKVPTIVEFDIVAYPVARRIMIPIDTEKQTYKRKVGTLQEKEEHEKEWKRITKGKMSFNVKVVKPPATAPTAQE